jgi:hypothetical protein
MRWVTMRKSTPCVPSTSAQNAILPKLIIHITPSHQIYVAVDNPSLAPSVSCLTTNSNIRDSSAKNISVRVEWLRQSSRAPSQPSETPRWRITAHLVSIPGATLHIALQSLFHRFFSLWQSPVSNDHCGLQANCDHMSEWIHWVHTGVWIAMQWVTWGKYLLVFLLPVRKMQFSLY